jgi:FRG domain
MDIEIKNLNEYLEYCNKREPNCDSYFRGQEDASWDINSTLFRFSQERKIDASVQLQKLIIEKFKNELKINTAENNIYMHPEGKAKYSEWHLLSQMQHIGIPTPLIDFTTDETIALKFALNYQKIEKDVAIFKFNLPINSQPIASSNCNKIDPFTTRIDWLVNLPYHCNGIDTAGEKNKLTQNGWFLLHNFNRINTPLNKNDVFKNDFQKIIIKASNKTRIKKEFIERYGACEFKNETMYLHDEKLIQIKDNLEKWIPSL